MKTQRGFTLIELFITIVIVMIVGTIGFNFYIGSQRGFSNISVGVNGMTESRCIDGYKFIIGGDGQARQIMDSVGHGVQCEGMR
jgi:prepilin-type N-terminal cleavage/methylation domain-containing protein